MLSHMEDGLLIFALCQPLWAGSAGFPFFNWMLSKLDPVEIKMKTNDKYVAKQLLSLSYCCVTNPSWARASLSINIMYILVALLIVLTVPIWSPGTSQVHLPSPLFSFSIILLHSQTPQCPLSLVFTTLCEDYSIVDL